jgi:hypothetical protein
MECLPVEKIPEGDNWTYELKLDGYRLQAVKVGSKVILYSRRGIDLTKRYEYVAMALAGLPDDTVIDGELVALDEEGKPNFNLLQNFRSAESHIVFYAFDILVHDGCDVRKLPISKRRAILGTVIEPSVHVWLVFGFSWHRSMPSIRFDSYPNMATRSGDRKRELSCLFCDHADHGWLQMDRAQKESWALRRRPICSLAASEGQDTSRSHQLPMRFSMPGMPMKISPKPPSSKIARNCSMLCMRRRSASSIRINMQLQQMKSPQCDLARRFR